jgi:hypothetical protein
MVLCFIGPFILLVFSMAEGDQLKDKKLYNIYKFVGITLTSIEVLAIPLFFLSVHVIRPWLTKKWEAEEKDQEYDHIEDETSPA